MTEGFITWEMLQIYGSFVSVVYLIVKFTKDLQPFKSIPTKYFAWVVAFILLVVVNLRLGTLSFNNWYDIILYALSAILISMSGNGIADFNKKVQK